MQTQSRQPGNRQPKEREPVAISRRLLLCARRSTYLIFLKFRKQSYCIVYVKHDILFRQAFWQAPMSIEPKRTHLKGRPHLF